MPPPRWPLGYYLVAYLDVLGQRQALRGLTRLPRTTEEQDATRDILRRTAGVVVTLRDSFLTYFRIFTEPPLLASQVPAEHRSAFESLTRTKAIVRGFSDSIVITVPLIESRET